MSQHARASWHEVPTQELLGPLNDVEQQHAPPTLFVAGDRSLLRQGARVSIVGSRQATPDGCARVRKLVARLCERQIVVVSGLAQGIDTAAHRATLDRDGRTIAVIGTPLDQVYPKANAALQHQIMAEHLCVSQFPVGSPVERKNFPMRNRTMALLSDATVIIEASETSGSLSQGWEALRLGRELLILKAVADDESLSWPKKLLHFGAQVLSDETLEPFLDSLPERTEADLSGRIPF